MSKLVGLECADETRKFGYSLWVSYFPSVRGISTYFGLVKTADDGQLTLGLSAWFLASVLPLPPKPPISKDSSKEPESHRLSRLEVARDLEKSIGLAGAKRYENARWWRNLNRVMSVLGIIIVAAMVSATN